MTSNKNSVKKNSHKKRVLTLLVLASLFVVILVSSGFSTWIQVINNQNETEKLEAKLEELLEEEASLKSEVVKLQDPDYIARYAREKYMYTTDGEVILKIVDYEEE